ncbi:MAG: carbohydrate-binding protein [Streptosporangiaceae bacterium]
MPRVVRLISCTSALLLAGGLSAGLTAAQPAAAAITWPAQVESVITTMNVTHLDFDIESSEETNSADLDLTAQALAQVRSWASSNGTPLSISYTIPVLATGLTQDGLNVLDAAVANGFTPNVVNIMTMDYGTSGTEMGTAANQALDATASQLESVFGISSSSAYGMLGNTPMIGQNDTSDEIFTLADAATVESYAAQQGIAMLSFWSEGRDNGGCPGTTTASSTCSGISQSSGAFTEAFQAFTTGGGGGGSPPPPPPPPPTGCQTAWSSSGTYTSGDEVSYNGDNWTANQWNDDEVPGGASGAWNDDGSC